MSHIKPPGKTFRRTNLGSSNSSSNDSIKVTTSTHFQSTDAKALNPEKKINANNQRLIGNALFKQGKYKEAVAAYELGLKLVPNDITLLSNAGIACVKDHNKEKALMFFKEVLGIEPNHIKANYWWIQLHVPGLEIVQNALTVGEERELITMLESGSWNRNPDGHYDEFTPRKEAEYAVLVRILNSIISKNAELCRDLDLTNVAVTLVKYDAHGKMKAHVDNKYLTGAEVFVLSLGCQGKVVYAKQHSEAFTLILPSRSLYKMSGQARNDFTHEIQNGNEVRYAVLFHPPGLFHMGTKFNLKDSSGKRLPYRIVCPDGMDADEFMSLYLQYGAAQNI